MAVLEKIRVKLGIFITIVIAVALLSFIIDPDTLRSTAQMFSSKNEVGKMKGKNISYKSFYDELTYYTKLAELTANQNVNEEAVQSSLREAAWQSIFDKEVFIPKTKDAGINVADDEILDLTQGSQISPVLTKQPMFLDQNGNYNRENLIRFVQSISADATGNADFYWNYLENAVYKQQLYTKYASLLEKSNIYNSLEKERAILENNVISDVDFVMVPLGFKQDSSITISNKEIKEYYNARKESMKQVANRDIEYVMFEVIPSQDDIDETKVNFDKLYEEFKVSGNLKNFIALNSDSKWNTYYFSKEELESVPEFAEYAFGKNKMNASEINTSDKSYMAARIISFKSLPDSVSANFMFVQTDAQADSVVNAFNKGVSPVGFSELGWITQQITAQNNVSHFDVAFEVKENKAIKIKNDQGWTVLYIKERTSPKNKVQLAVLSKNIIPSESTYRDFLMKATEFSDKAEGKYEKFTSIIKEENLPVIPVSHITEATKRIGVCENAKEVTRWAFEAKKGEVSDVIIVNNKYYFVAAVTQVRKEGYIPVSELKQEITMAIMNEKKLEKMVAEVSEKTKDCKTLDQVAETLGSTVSHQTGVSFGSMQSRSLDPKFIGAVAGAEQGILTGPVAGEIGVYIFQIADRQTGKYFTEKDAMNNLAQITSYQMKVLQNVLMSTAEIKDNRARFF